ncbi:hypothetical protein AB0953_07545 [Streptomyces sp. NPDC046866]|uniref:hypothetical protein n=1 Tax=Streptomyces sp. NPDC046866 TaxID=3154921 RepID=UPI0034561762
MSQQFQPPAPDSLTTAAPAAPYAAAPARSGTIGLGIAAAVVAALVAAGVYGAIMSAIDRQIGYAAVGVGLVIGLAAGRVGGRNIALPAVSAVLALGAVYLGQLVYVALELADYAGTGVADVVFDKPGISGIADIWKEGAEAMDYVFLAIGGAVAFSAAKKTAD